MVGEWYRPAQHSVYPVVAPTEVPEFVACNVNVRLGQQVQGNLFCAINSFKISSEVIQAGVMRNARTQCPASVAGAEIVLEPGCYL